MENLATVLTSRSAWKAAIELDFLQGPHRSFVKRKHIGPLGMQRALYPENEVCHVYLLHPPGGVVGGDSLNITTSSHKGSYGFVTTPGATKFYRSAGDTAYFNQTLQVETASLEWFPQENIYFSGAQVKSNTTINLNSDARFMGWEIQVFGRLAGEQPFRNGHVDAKLSVNVDNHPLLLDRLRIVDGESLSHNTGLRGCCIFGTQLFYPFNPVALDRARHILSQYNEFYLTAFDRCLLVRYLGDNIEQARNGFQELWKQLRGSVNTRKSIMPRIWLT